MATGPVFVPSSFFSHILQSFSISSHIFHSQMSVKKAAVVSLQEPKKNLLEKTIFLGVGEGGTRKRQQRLKNWKNAEISQVFSWCFGDMQLGSVTEWSLAERTARDLLNNTDYDTNHCLPLVSLYHRVLASNPQRCCERKESSHTVANDFF